VVALSIYLVKTSPMLADVRVTVQPMVHETEVAHAAGRRMLGPHARVGGRWWGWYASGAEHWYDVERDLVAGFLTFDPATYLSNVDALEVCPSGDDPGHFPSWYADGTLKLRGFYFAQTIFTLRCVELSSHGAAPLVGYAAWGGQLYRFQEEEDGGYEALSMVCGPGGEDWHQPWAGVFSVSLDMVHGPEAGRRMVTVLAPRSMLTPAGAIGRSCREVSRIRGTLLSEDWRRLVEQSRRDDPVMHFYRNIEDMPGYAGVGLAPDAIPPDGAVPLENAIADLSGIVAADGARVEHVPQVRVTTIPVPGVFSVLIPVKRTEAATSAGWIVLKLRVRRGRVGLGACPKDRSLLSRTNSIAPSAEPQTVALRTPDLLHTTDIVVFSEGSATSEVDIYEAGVLVQGAAGAERKP
jgi:hypothetical protein